MTIPDLLFIIPEGEFQRRLSAVDCAVLDLDGSIYRGVSQGALALGVIGRLAFKPERLGDRRYLPAAVVGGVALAICWMAPGCRRARRFNRWMIGLWCSAFRGVPMSYFRSAAVPLPRRSCPGVRETMALLAERGPVAIVSVGLKVVVDEYLRQFTAAGSPLITRCHSNRMVSGTHCGREVFAGRYEEPLITTGPDKAEAGERMLRALGVECPLVVGNDEGDVPLARLARERGGVAIGIRPPRRIRDEFDLCLLRSDWRPLADLLRGFSLPPSFPSPVTEPGRRNPLPTTTGEG